jgi:serine protease Do
MMSKWVLGATLVLIASQPVAGDAQSVALAGMDFRHIVQESKNKVFPALVFIRVLRESHESGKRVTQEVSGSGVLISADGELLTNWHVVDKATEVRCLLYDGEAYAADILGTDKDLDLALIKLRLPAGVPALPYAELADSARLKEGDFVMAMGAPWGLSRSVSIGIVSCTRRFLPETSEYSLWLQTDASISPGNSGGPLINTDGHVVGINTRGIMSGGDMGFSIPSETIRQVLARMREHGKVNWAWTGLRLQPLRDFNRNIYFDATEGVIVAGTDPESPARRAGIRDRDRILRIGEHPLNGLTEEDLPALRRTLGLLEIDRPVSVELVREGTAMTVELTPAEKGSVEGEELDCPRWDLTVKAINQFDNPDLHFYRKEGVFIYGIKYPGNAATAKLGQRDIILQIGGKDVATLNDVKAIHAEALANIADSPRLTFTVLRNGLRRQFVLDFSHDFEKE